MPQWDFLFGGVFGLQQIQPTCLLCDVGRPRWKIINSPVRTRGCCAKKPTGYTWPLLFSGQCHRFFYELDLIKVCAKSAEIRGRMAPLWVSLCDPAWQPRS